MSNGILIFAHNNRDVDYSLIALISGKLASKNLKCPASLITDDSTIDWMKQSKIFDEAKDTFENIISVERPQSGNNRNLFDGPNKQLVAFNNTNRYLAYEYSPYDKTLLIDSDYFIMSNNYSNYWNVDANIMISESIKDFYYRDRTQYEDRYISPTGIKMLWATAVMFDKSNESKLFFDLLKNVTLNYEKYSDIFRFGNFQFRNDIAFSVVDHILSGYKQIENKYYLPPVLTTLGKDILVSATDRKLKFLVADTNFQEYHYSSSSDIDIHIMNKQSIVRNAKKILEMI